MGTRTYDRELELLSSDKAGGLIPCPGFFGSKYSASEEEVKKFDESEDKVAFDQEVIDKNR